MRLQTQLTLSHLAVTAISVIILLIGLLAGYAVYLRSDLSAAWAGDNAAWYAEDYSYAIWDDGETAAEFIEFHFLEVLEVSEDAANDEWLIVTDKTGQVTASNYNTRYPIGSQLMDDLPMGMSATDFADPNTQFGPNWLDDGSAISRNVDSRHMGLAPVANAFGEWAGWAFYHGGQEDLAFMQQQLARDGLLASAGLSVVALLVSGVMGFWLAKRFGRKLQTLATASAAYANGQFNQRVSLTGKDEIGQLGTQFNTMADTIEHQMGDLRQLADTNARLAAEAEGLARLEERNRLARDLHDAVKQQLFGLNLTLGSVQSILETKPELARQRLSQVVAQTQDIQLELDTIINQLRPASLGEEGLVNAVRALADQWSEQTAVAVTLSAHAEQPLPIEIEQAAFRVIQESLQNAGKHANADSVTIALNYAQNALTLSIRDDGDGFAPSPIHTGHGLTNMRERMEQLGGTLDVHSQPAKGCEVTATIPLDLTI